MNFLSVILRVRIFSSRVVDFFTGSGASEGIIWADMSLSNLTDTVESFSVISRKVVVFKERCKMKSQGLTLKLPEGTSSTGVPSGASHSKSVKFTWPRISADKVLT